ncbi:TOM (translocase of outer membrane) complex component [Lithohypha guttulata]|uniref:TOM (translocase of outer membrane) complex component n=1 Tax=Lithohypha guttulata TaxID=1690604 RepID=UPI002DE07C34|nr:TOM (translocase of outer membrane) complex component [Lithohypha guttulata]KAK5105369.1 TOM (translocase of outer membrane) complex component [Lithohypha guttulata]
MSASGLHIEQASNSSLWDRVSTWVSENRAVAYTIAGTVVVVTAGGVVYYLSHSPEKNLEAQNHAKKSKKERRKEKKEQQEAASREQPESGVKLIDEEAAIGVQAPKPATVEAEDEVPEITESTVEAFSPEDRNNYAAKLKVAGNKAYGSKDYNSAIDLYGKAILCKPDPVYYSNRAACYNVLSEWDKVVEDTSAAIAMDSEYVKALNRRAHAYEHLGKFSEALLDYTASCIIDGFKNEQSAQSVERLLKKVAEKKGKAILEKKGKKLPSATFVSNYLQSFRPRPAPAGLEESAELDENTGKGQLQRGLAGMGKRTSEGYERAATAFKKALELGDLGEYEAFALNMRGTFAYLEGDVESALKDLTDAIEKDPSLSQAYIKRASMQLELGSKEQASADFELAAQQNKDDPDIYYHRAQLHFILGEWVNAAKDYQKSIDLDPDFIYSHIQLGVTQYKMGSITSSMATFRRTIKKFDKVPDVYNYYGELLLDQQKYTEAIERFETAIDMEKQQNPTNMNVLPLINKALALFQWKQDFKQAEELCEKALVLDPECDIAVATMAQLLLQQGKVTQALEYFERAAELSRTEGEIVNALSYAEATRTQLEVSEKYPQLQARLQQMGASGLGRGPGM